MAGLLVTGTTSDAGKSLVVTGLCRAWARAGIRVAPFKSQNMSNNSMVCEDGSEIGRAQYLQAQAAGVVASLLHNPVLLKPGSDRRAFVVLRGRPAGELGAGEYATGRAHLAEAAFAAYEELADSVDLVVCEGAGSPAEVNLRAGDYVNMGLARRFELPTLLVADIDRGGALAAVVGTSTLLSPADRGMLRGFVMNKFRGDHDVLAPGLSVVSDRTGLPWLGTLPWLEDVWLDSEDALSVGRWHPTSPSTPSPEPLRVAVVRFPRVSNATDVDALAAEPGVEVRVTTDPSVCREADLLVLPGSRATVDDLAWLRGRGLDEVVAARVAAARPVLGVCGGYEMLGSMIEDTVESTVERVHGLGHLEATTQFRHEKVLGRPHGSWRGHPVSGYEIHHGIVSAEASFPGGTCSGTVWGTIWHGTLECDDFRRAWLTEVAEAAGSPWRPQAGAPSFASRRETMIDRLADAVTEHLDLDQLLAWAMEKAA
ncbi:cobyric acid synthase [Pedococcus sp. NPDC057267]|uniref:cobyric acid synthase n=1 Tax=Pedococcus sp. NPDC057267 TaxID=3346077 RepID=UPI00363C2364